jgi:hypothetical protein
LNVRSSAGTCAIAMLRAREVGRELVVGDGDVGELSPRRQSMSISPLRKASQRGCCASITETSTRPTIGMRLPFCSLRIACPTASSGAGCASKYSSRKFGFASSTIFEARFQKVTR